MENLDQVDFRIKEDREKAPEADRAYDPGYSMPLFLILLVGEGGEGDTVLFDPTTGEQVRYFTLPVAMQVLADVRSKDIDAYLAAIIE